MYNAAKFAKLVGVNVKTLQRWDRIGKLKALRTSTNRRYYTREHLDAVLQTTKTEGLTVCYCRVSSQNQRGDLKNQRQAIEDFLTIKGIVNVEFIMEIGGGLNLKRPMFQKLIFDIEDKKVDRLVIAHKDRLCRFGFDLIDAICKRHGCEILVLNQEKLSPEQEMVTDLMTIVHCFSSRLYGLRNYRKSIKEALKDSHNVVQSA